MTVVLCHDCDCRDSCAVSLTVTCRDSRAEHDSDFG
jgi:hypothetical protein